jgi:hypothetical protein
VVQATAVVLLARHGTLEQTGAMKQHALITLTMKVIARRIMMVVQVGMEAHAVQCMVMLLVL